MKKILLAALLLFSAVGLANAQPGGGQRVLRHVVQFGWKEGTDTAYIRSVVNAFRALPAQIPLIKAFEWGTNNSPEKLNKGLTHCFLLTFSSEADRDAYLIHPAHKAFGARLKPFPDQITVFDYWANQ
jgi:hypothetical protein